MSAETYGYIYMGVNIAAAVAISVGSIVKANVKCFKEGTLVLAKEGHKKIEDIIEGDLVWAYDEETGESDWKPVVQLFRNVSSFATSVEIQADDGTVDKLVSTPGHKYYLPFNESCRDANERLEHAGYVELSDKWVSAKDLKKGDKVVLASADSLTGKPKYGIVIGVKTEECEEFTTYNFEVEDFHTYYVGKNGVCTHNANCTYDIDKLVKTQPKEMLNETSIANNMELIQSGADVRVPIRVHKGTAYVVDGHHRLEAFARLGYQRVPIQYVHASQLGRAPYYRTMAQILADSIFNY